MNWPVLIITGIILVALVLFLIRRNMKDEEKLEEQLKNDYHKPKDDEGDTDTDDMTR